MLLHLSAYILTPVYLAEKASEELLYTTAYLAEKKISEELLPLIISYNIVCIKPILHHQCTNILVGVFLI